jgi:hypothetical protein
LAAWWWEAFAGMLAALHVCVCGIESKGRVAELENGRWLHDRRRRAVAGRTEEPPLLALSHAEGVHLAECMAQVVRELSIAKGSVTLYFHVDEFMDGCIRVLLDSEVEVSALYSWCDSQS